MIRKQLNNNLSMIRLEGLVMTRKPRLPAGQQRKYLSIPACRPFPAPSLPTVGALHFSINLLFQAPGLTARFCKTKPICRSKDQGQAIDNKRVMAHPAPVDRWKTNPIPTGGGEHGATASRQINERRAKAGVFTLFTPRQPLHWEFSGPSICSWFGAIENEK